jgi:GTP-binding protein HflX
MPEKNNAILLTLNEDKSEILELADTLGYNVLETFYQNRSNPDVNSYMGKGKIKEISEFIENSKDKINLVIVDGELKPSQWFNLEKKFDTNVFDRVRLILSIFEKRAERKEAKLQVKLAQLQYERPFVRELIHRARSGEHPGFLAGGEYQVDDYYEMIKKQTKKIKDDLESIRDERQLRRSHRQKGGFYLVSLAGYTNAGKSSLLNILSDETVKVEGKLFSTLSTTTRKIEKKSVPILLTDTVGFLKNLPSLIIDAFHSTLEEIELADVVLLVVDASDEINIIQNKLKVSIDELIEIGVKSPILIVLNKIDKITDEELDYLITNIKNKFLKNQRKVIPISVKKKYNIDFLLDEITDSLPDLIRYKIKLPNNEEVQPLISWIHEKANVFDISYGNFIKIYLESNPSIKNKILSENNKIELIEE